MLIRNREWYNKNIYNVTTYKALKWPERTTLKLPLARLIWLNIIGWMGGSLLRCNYYDEYLACEQEDFCERYIKFKGDWELLSGERSKLFCWKLLSYSLTALERRSQFWSRVILFPKINRFTFSVVTWWYQKKMHFLKPDPSPKWMSPTASGLSYEVGRIGEKKVNGDWDISNKRGHNMFHTGKLGTV